MASAYESPPDRERDATRKVLAECNQKLASHRAALEAGADPSIVTEWIAETQTKRARAEAALSASAREGQSPLTRDEIADLVRKHSDHVAVLAAADRSDKARLYKELGLVLTFNPSTRRVLVEARFDQHSHHVRGLSVGVGRGT